MEQTVMALPAKKILIIEDDEIMMDSLATLVRMDGYIATTAMGGAEGIRQALRSRPDLILCDLLMPGVDGFAVLARLRAEAATAKIPFIFVTSSNEERDSRVSFLLGATDYLTKPVDPEKLMSLIGQRLEPGE